MLTCTIFWNTLNPHTLEPALKKQALVGIPAGGRECPGIPCGYHGPFRSDLVKLFARTHIFLYRKVEEVARGNDLIEAAPYQLQNSYSMLFLQTKNMLYKVIEYPSSNGHFKESYDQEITTGQTDFGYEAGRCPRPNYEDKAVKPESRDIMITLHHVYRITVLWQIWLSADNQ